MLSFEKFSEFCVEVTNFIADTLHAPSAEFQCTYKDDGTEVTSCDFLIEDKIRNLISSAFPECGIIGEERRNHHGSTEWSWIIDPIDGTFGFSKGAPLFGTLIGLIKDNEPKYGFLRLPMLGDTWISGNGKVALLEGSPLQTTFPKSLNKALILTTDQQTIVNSPINKFWQSALKQGATARTWGDCFGYFMVCKGEAELMTDTSLKPHDILPLIPILEGAGVEIHKIDCEDYSNIIACKKGVMEQLS